MLTAALLLCLLLNKHKEKERITHAQCISVKLHKYHAFFLFSGHDVFRFFLRQNATSLLCKHQSYDRLFEVSCDHNCLLLEVEVKCSSHDEQQAWPAGKVKICFTFHCICLRKGGGGPCVPEEPTHSTVNVCSNTVVIWIE